MRKLLVLSWILTVLGALSLAGVALLTWGLSLLLGPDRIHPATSIPLRSALGRDLLLLMWGAVCAAGACLAYRLAMELKPSRSAGLLLLGLGGWALALEWSLSEWPFALFYLAGGLIQLSAARRAEGEN